MVDFVKRNHSLTSNVRLFFRYLPASKPLPRHLTASDSVAE